MLNLYTIGYTEKSPECCHRRLAAEYLNRKFDNCFSVIHLA